MGKVIAYMRMKPADERMIAVYRHGCGGSDSEFVLWVRI